MSRRLLLARILGLQHRGRAGLALADALASTRRRIVVVTMGSRMASVCADVADVGGAVHRVLAMHRAQRGCEERPERSAVKRARLGVHIAHLLVPRHHH